MTDPIKPIRKAIYDAIKTIAPTFDSFADEEQNDPFIVIESIRAASAVDTLCGRKWNVTANVTAFCDSGRRGGNLVTDDIAADVMAALLGITAIDGLVMANSFISETNTNPAQGFSRTYYRRQIIFELEVQ